MKWFPLIGGIFSICYAVFLFVNPLTSVATIAWIIALLIFINGIANFLEYLNAPERRSFWQLFQSLLSIIIGFILLTSSIFALTKAFVSIIAYWVLFSGILRLLTGLQLRKWDYTGSSIYISSAVVAIIFGIILLGAPLLSASIIGMLIALLFLLLGIALIIVFFRLN
ncbi:DUF308 domain-containing protein [Streptococcus dentapri]|uniref:DUF308 domain-containing protein n=1 Tax=Streptococcus dentapri TaxID=573564 RepID=A0ABV8D2L4_9STRE